MTHINRCCLLLFAITLITGVFAKPRLSYAQATPRGQQGCAPGTVVGGNNLIVNGDFSIDPGPGPLIDPAAGFESGLPNRGSQRYPDDGGGGGFSIQRGPVQYYDNKIIGRPFPGDSQREVPPTETYFYSNPVPNGADMLLWRQRVTGLVPNTTYNFFAYIDNLIIPNGLGADPQIELRVDGIVAGAAITVTKEPDQWMPIQYSFITGPDQTEATLEIFDMANIMFGDDFAMTQVSLKQCVSGLGVAKEALQPVKNGDFYDIEYRIRLHNYGVDPQPLKNVQVIDNLAKTFAGAQSFQVVRLESASMQVNSAFNGVSDTRLLAGTDSLASGESAIITLGVKVKLGTGPGAQRTFQNIAIANALAGNVQVEDDSTPGSNPDPNSNGDPKDPVEDTPTGTTFGGVIFVPVIRR